MFQVNTGRKEHIFIEDLVKSRDLIVKVSL